MMHFLIFLVSIISYNAVESKVEISGNETKQNFITFPLVWQKSPRMKLLEMGVHPNVIKSLFIEKNKIHEFGKKTGPVQNDTTQLYKFMDNEYYAKVSLGHPGQSFNIILDTSWADSFVPSVSCPITNIVCRMKNKYDHSKSSFYMDKKASYSESGMIGDLAMDLMHIGHLNVTNFTFAELTYVAKSMFLNKADGIFGLGFKELMSYDGVPFFYRLTELNPQMPKVFTFYLNRDTTTSKGGTMTMGIIMKKHYTGNLNYFDVTSKSYWQLNMNKVSIADGKKDISTFCEKGCNCMIDTGESTIGVPSSALKEINKRIRASELLRSGRYTVDCRTVLKLPDIHFYFNGIAHNLRGQEYIQNINIGPMHFCVTAFVAIPLENTWTLGGSFMYRYYTVFDLEKRRIGFAKANL